MLDGEAVSSSGVFDVLLPGACRLVSEYWWEQNKAPD